jgi:hypothetical protein
MHRQHVVHPDCSYSSFQGAIYLWASGLVGERDKRKGHAMLYSLFYAIYIIKHLH